MAKLAELFPSKYLTAADLQGREVTAVIERVEIDEFEDNGRKTRKPVVYFQDGHGKAMIANKTNAVAIADICGHSDTDLWGGVRVTLFPTMVQFGSRMTEAIRVKRAAQPVATEPTGDALSGDIPW